jgi:hypothetical protein
MTTVAAGTCFAHPPPRTGGVGGREGEMSRLPAESSQVPSDGSPEHGSPELSAPAFAGASRSVAGLPLSTFPTPWDQNSKFALNHEAAVQPQINETEAREAAAFNC